MLLESNARPVDFSKHGAYTTHKFKPMSDTTGGILSDHVQLPLEPQKALHYFISHRQEYSPRPVTTL